MKILKLLNPTAWLGQMVVLMAFVLLGVSIGLYIAPPSTSVSNHTRIKAKKGGTVSSGGLEPLDCDDYIRDRSMKELRDIRKY